MKKPVFTGTCTAIVTPFTESGINYPVLYQLIDRQIDASVQAILLCGTTGEASTMTEAEQLELIQRGCEYINGRTAVIAGTGSNNTAHAAELSKKAEEYGADAVLIVTPYYNKATPTGLIKHFNSIADSITIPVITYNVPSRTGVDIPMDVYRELSKHPNINGVKEASGSIAKVSRIIGSLGDNFCVWSGNDDQNVAITALGGKGAISVLSNICPQLTEHMITACLNGRIQTAARLQNTLMPIIDALFCEVNPIPCKEALAILGYDTAYLRLPLCSMSDENKSRLRKELELLKNMTTG